MPELAELKLSSQYVNQYRSIIFDNISKNPQHKGLDIQKPFDKFYIQAESRGKELLLYLKDFHSSESKSLKFTFGMSGNFRFTKTGSERKHSHLMFYSQCGNTLSFVDVRRFGKWKWDGWNPGRGEDPTQNYQGFVDKINKNLDKKIFDKPIGEVLMNQTYFNGIGNYLRAEILYKTSQDPFQCARDAIKQNPKILEYCNILPLEAFVLGGGQLKDWENPFGISPDPFKKWMRCYGNPNMEKIKDSNGRTLWYDPKFKKPLNQ